jgi:hypothetical protein
MYRSVLPEKGKRKLFKRATLKFLAQPPVVGQMYRYNCADDGSAWMLLTPSLISEVMVHTHNVTDGGEVGPAFATVTWSNLVSRGLMVHQEWYNQLDL